MTTDIRNARALLTALHRAAVEGADPFARTRDAVAAWWREHEQTHASSGARAPIRIFAMGKAAVAMTSGAVRALHEAGLDPQHGVVVAYALPSDRPDNLPPEFVLLAGDHPIPGPASLLAADAIDSAILELQPGDVAMVLLSGGTTALTAAPVAALSQAVGDAERAQAHLANLADTLLESGLAIHEMNAIRRRMLRYGAGRLAVALADRGASVIPVFAISDVIGDDPAVIGSGPCSPDPLDEPGFLALLDAHGVRAWLQRDTAAFLGVAGDGRPPLVPASSHPAFARVRYEVVACNADAVKAMTAAARRAGITHVLPQSVPLEGEAAPLGDWLARHATARARALPADESILLAFGGEPVVHLRAALQHAWDDGASDEAGDGHARAALARLPLDDATHRQLGLADPERQIDPERGEERIDEPLRGGRMQALALAAAFALEEAAGADDWAPWRITILAAGTDGRDGPTDAAGAIVDAATPAAARRSRRSPERDLATGRSWFPLDAADALLRTGPTGTNVMDVVAVLIAPSRQY